jgi:hypothetical protein
MTMITHTFARGKSCPKALWNSTQVAQVADATKPANVSDPAKMTPIAQKTNNTTSLIQQK